MEKGKNRINITKIIKYIGNIIMILAIAIIINKIRSYDVDYSIIFSKKNIFSFMLITLIYSVTVILGGVPWTNIINALLSCKIQYWETMLIYTKSNVFKYIPGNVFQYVGRNELAVRKNLKHSSVALSTLIDVSWNIFSIILLAILLARKNLFRYVAQQYENFGKEVSVFFVISVLVVLLLCLIMFKKKRKEIVKVLHEVFSIEFAKALGKNFLFYIIQGLVNAGLYVAIFSIISGECYSIQSTMSCMGAMLVAFAAGFITPGAPGGVGIREAVSLFLLGTVIRESVILTGIVIMRVLSIAGDIFSFILIWIIENLRNQRTGEQRNVR